MARVEGIEKNYKILKSFFEISPTAAIAFHQFVGLSRAPGSSGIVGEITRRQRLPHVEHGIDNAPTGFDHVGALEQRGVADHAVMQQAFVASRRSDPEIVSIGEVHIHFAELHRGSGSLGGEAQRDAFFRLDVQHQLVGHHVFHLSFAEQHEGRAPELNYDMGMASGQPLAGAQIEGNSRPAPVVDEEPHGDESFGARVRRHALFGAVSRHALIVHGSVSVLPADGFAEHVLATEGLNGMQDFGLLVADRVRLERNRRFHRGESDELHDVVGHHVAEGARSVVVAAAFLDAHGFGDRNLDVVDVAAIPDRLEDSVRETERQNILDRFFSQVVIDAVDLAFRSDFRKVLVQNLGGIEIVAKRFFDNHAPPVVVFFLHQADLRNPLDDVAEEVGRGSEIEKIVAVRVVLLIDLGKGFFQLVVSSGVIEIPTYITYAADKPFPQFGIDRSGGELFEAFGELLARVIIAHWSAAHSDHGELAGQQLLAGEIVESGNQL